MIVVTGGAGFIGSVLVWRLLQAGASEVAVVDDPHQDDRWRNLEGARIAACFSPGDFLARIEGTGALPPIECVFHLGACSSTTETDWEFLRRNNLEYSRRVAWWCLRHGVRMIYASSAATYGDGSQGFAADLDRLDGLRPLNLYARSKHEFDCWVRDQGAFDRLVGLKYFNVYGPQEYHKGAMRSMVLKAFELVVAGEPIRLFRSYRPEFADGEQVRDFLYVDDAVAMTLWFLEHPRAAGLFNLGAGEAGSWNTLAEAVFRALDLPPRIEYIDMPEIMRATYQYSTRAELGGLRAAGCELRPRGLAAGVEEYVGQYLANGRRYLSASSSSEGNAVP